MRAGVLPTVVPGAPGGLQMPARSLYDMNPRGPGYAPKGEVCPQASEEMLRSAREQAAKAERAGIEAARQSGLVPRGPPSLPTGVVVVEQKYVDFIVGPGGQSLTAVNVAAGVNVQLDQSNKFSGYSIANIYGPEAAARQAKFSIEFKVSQWLPRGQHYGAPAIPSQPSRPIQTAPIPQANSANSSATYDPVAGSGASTEGLPPEAANDPLVQSLAKWPSLALSAARASAGGAGGAASPGADEASGVL